MPGTRRDGVRRRDRQHRLPERSSDRARPRVGRISFPSAGELDSPRFFSRGMCSRGSLRFSLCPPSDESVASTGDRGPDGHRNLRYSSWQCWKNSQPFRADWRRATPASLAHLSCSQNARRCLAKAEWYGPHLPSRPPFPRPFLNLPGIFCGRLRQFRSRCLCKMLCQFCAKSG